MIDEFKFHHIGIVVRSIEDYLKHSIFSQNIQDPVYDPLQDSNIVLIETDKALFIELIEPVTSEATTYDFLHRSGKSSIFHHTCFEVPNKDFVDNICKKLSIKIFWGPHPAVLFDGKDIMFGYNKNQEIIEFLLTE